MSDRKNRGYQSKFAMVNKITGEEVEGGVPVFVAGKVKWNNNGGYFVGFQEAFGVIAQDKTMTGETLRIWMHLLSQLGFENFVVVKRGDISKELGIKGPNISRAISKLVEKGLIARGPKVGHSYAYRLDMNAAWRGSPDAYNENKELNQKMPASELAKERWKVFQEVHLPKHDK